jgi:transposase
MSLTNVGLASSPFCSGSLDRDQGISKTGNPKARVLMIELAWTWLRYQPESALSRWFRERVGTQASLPPMLRRRPAHGWYLIRADVVLCTLAANDAERVPLS